MLPTTMTVVMSYMKAAKDKHGPLTTDLQRAHLIMSEEMGEFTKEVADKTRVHAGHSRETSWAKVEHELLQTIGVGVAIFENIQRIKKGEEEEKGNAS